MPNLLASPTTGSTADNGAIAVPTTADLATTSKIAPLTFAPFPTTTAFGGLPPFASFPARRR
jgi:hypothetical protein